MSEFLNGYYKPRFKILNSDGSIKEIIELPYCGIQGLSEGYQKIFKTHELHTGEILNFDYKGERIRFVLDYSQYSSKSLLIKARKIEDYLTSFSSYKVFLYPRSDNLSRRFEVVLPADNSTELRILTGGVNAQGHKGFALTVVTKFPVNKKWEEVDGLRFQSPYQIV